MSVLVTALFLCSIHTIVAMEVVPNTLTWKSFNITPVNTAGYTGQDVVLYCSLVDSSLAILEWLEFVSTSDGKRISINDEIQHPSKGKYNISGKYNLVIHNASLSDAGTYACYDDLTNSYAYAELLLIETGPICSDDVLTVVEGEEFNLCGVRGSGAWLPVINATFQDVQTSYTTPYNVINEGTFVVNFSLAVNRTLNTKIMNYTCDTFFPMPPINSLPNDTYNRFYNRNVPLFSDLCRGDPTMDVQYFSGIVQFDVNSTEMYPSNSNISLDIAASHNITCISDANPQVTCVINLPTCISEFGDKITSCSFVARWEDIANPDKPCTLYCEVKNFISKSINEPFSFYFT